VGAKLLQRHVYVGTALSPVSAVLEQSSIRVQGNVVGPAMNRKQSKEKLGLQQTSRLPGRRYMDNSYMCLFNALNINLLIDIYKDFVTDTWVLAKSPLVSGTHKSTVYYSCFSPRVLCFHVFPLL